MFTEKLTQITLAELQTYGSTREDRSPLAERIGAYWTALGRPDLDGTDRDVPWSAAFISFMVRAAGAATSFPYSAQHSAYFYRTINDRVSHKKTGFWGYEIGTIDIQAGDILGMNREGTNPIAYDWAEHHSDYKSHSDIVVEVNASGIKTVGGNVSQTVHSKTFGEEGGKLVNLAAPSQQPFVVIRSFLP